MRCGMAAGASHLAFFYWQTALHAQLSMSCIRSEAWLMRGEPAPRSRCSNELRREIPTSHKHTAAAISQSSSELLHPMRGTYRKVWQARLEPTNRVHGSISDWTEGHTGIVQSDEAQQRESLSCATPQSRAQHIPGAWLLLHAKAAFTVLEYAAFIACWRGTSMGGLPTLHARNRHYWMQVWLPSISGAFCSIPFVCGG